ncbi:hypothetical protein AB0D27_07855 [Streptomyces sp. NPDC048415]|uniref:hypothetical protein n=1 Tax=Streptomyces sp. NPDC048415 TaxID=3154822 RepID=UPI00341A15B0
MTDQPPLPPPDPQAGPQPAPAPPASFTAAPANQARTYQTGRDQNIHEHQHHYYPTPASPPPARGSVRAGVAWSLAGAMILALGAFVGVDLWERHTASDATPAGDVGTPHTLPAKTPGSPRASRSPSPSGSPRVTASASTSQEKTAAPATASASGQPPRPTSGCGPWKTPDSYPNVQFHACGRIVGDRLYMIAEWRSISDSELVDVYLWLKDSTGDQLVYPVSQYPNGRREDSIQSWPTPRTDRQWREFPVLTPLAHGTTYQVCVKVLPGGATGPKISNPQEDGFQYGIKYP